MFGMDPYISSGYVLAIAMVISCLIYGWIRRGKGDD